MVIPLLLTQVVKPDPIPFYQSYLAGIFEGIGLGGLLFYLALYSWTERRLNAKLNERKNQFVALTSHYLLTPITIIQTAVDQLQNDSSLTLSERERLYNAILRGEKRLWILTEQLNMVGQIDQKELMLNIGVHDVVDVIDAAMVNVDPFARNKNIQLKVGPVDPNFVRQTRFDDRRIKQVIIALLDNAIKFSPDNSTVNVSVGFESNIYYIAIQDRGIGMSKQLIDDLPEKFHRGTSLYDFDYEGIGLGLHISQAIIALHQGSLTFSSKPKQGTVALIQLPAA